jgi:hypothetical protein
MYANKILLGCMTNLIEQLFVINIDKQLKEQ